MFEKGTEPRIEFRLWAEDRDFLISRGLAISPRLLARLRCGLAEGLSLRCNFLVSDFCELIESVASDAERAENRVLERRFTEILEELTVQLHEFAQSCRGSGPDPFSDSGSSFRQEVEQMLRDESFESLDEANRRLGELSEAHNRSPVPEFDGLSPLQVTRLIYSPWGDGDGPLSLNGSLDQNSLQDVELLANARVFLRALKESNGTKATSAGNLNRSFVRRMVGEMILPKGYLERLEQYVKTWNERDVSVLHIVRVLLSLAGLVRKFKGSFRITRRGERLAAEGSEGELYLLLFQTFFRKLNLGYLDGLPDCPGIQDTMAFSFLMLSRHAGSWTSPKDLAEKAFLPAVSQQIPAAPYDLDYRVILLETRILNPLIRFGLIESRPGPQDGTFSRRCDSVRKTSLFDLFMKFHCW